MVYQRSMPPEEMVAAQLELLMQNGRMVMVVTHMVGVAAMVMIFWPFVGLRGMLLWAAGFLILLLIRSLHMSNALAERRFRSAPRRLYWQLLVGTMLTGSIWAAVYIYAADKVPVSMQYILLLLIICLATFTIGFSVIVREYFLVYVFSSLWPVAWWSTVHYWQQPHNLVIGLSLLAFCAVLLAVCNQMHQSFRDMIALNWEREQTSRELGDMTGSLRVRNHQLQQARQKLSDLANVDELTGLGNRRLANRVLGEEISRARRAGTPLSVILLDVDYFKHYNDTYGHPAGDVVLKTLAGLMEGACSRAGEVVARYGGEEFLLILPGADVGSAHRTAARLRDRVRAARIAHATSEAADHLTVSQGVVTALVDSQLEPQDLVRRADAALYRAKARGRDAIETD